MSDDLEYSLLQEYLLTNFKDNTSLTVEGIFAVADTVLFWCAGEAIKFWALHDVEIVDDRYDELPVSFMVGAYFASHTISLKLIEETTLGVGDGYFISLSDPYQIVHGTLAQYPINYVPAEGVRITNFMLEYAADKMANGSLWLGTFSKIDDPIFQHGTSFMLKSMERHYRDSIQQGTE